MKQFLLLLMLLPGISAFSQIDTCIRTRWIAVDASQAGKHFFRIFEDSSFIATVYKKVQAGDQQLLYFEGSDMLDKGIKSYPEATVLLKRDSTFLHNGSRITWDGYLIFKCGMNIPLHNSLGEDQLVHCGGGAMCYVYPPDSVYYYPQYVEELRIREDRYTDSTGTVCWRATGIGFYSSSEELVKEMLWIDLRHLFAVLPQKERYSWYSFLAERRYTGEQYMQVGCHSHKRKAFYWETEQE